MSPGWPGLAFFGGGWSIPTVEQASRYGRRRSNPPLPPVSALWSAHWFGLGAGGGSGCRGVRGDGMFLTGRRCNLCAQLCSPGPCLLKEAQPRVCLTFYTRLLPVLLLLGGSQHSEMCILSYTHPLLVFLSVLPPSSLFLPLFLSLPLPILLSCSLSLSLCPSSFLFLPLSRSFSASPLPFLSLAFFLLSVSPPPPLTLSPSQSRFTKVCSEVYSL